MPRKGRSNPVIGARARSVLEVIYRLGEVSGADIMRELPDLPSYSAVRSILRALEGKGLVEHREEGLRYVYRPTVPKAEASRTALRRVMDTYFGGMPEHAMKALLDLSRDRAYDVDYAAMERLIRAARKEGR
jgi:predicted transcriptional regulator